MLKFNLAFWFCRFPLFVTVCNLVCHKNALSPFKWIQIYNVKRLQRKTLDAFSSLKHNHFIQQTCLSPHCWHRVVKSCLHGTLRSKKTDKLVSKRTTKSWIKNLLCRYFCWPGNRNNCGWMKNSFRRHVEQCLSCAYSLHKAPIHPPHNVLWLYFTLINILLETLQNQR